jgi:hypothetical protein
MGCKDCCFFISPRIGCLIIVLIELLWYCLNLYLSLTVALRGLQNHILRLDHYSGTSADFGSILYYFVETFG